MKIYWVNLASFLSTWTPTNVMEKLDVIEKDDLGSAARYEVR